MHFLLLAFSALALTAAVLVIPPPPALDEE